MTSRLRHKLEDMEQSVRRINESFCQIGTPLPALADTKRDAGEFVPVWKQEVRDEQGRRRLHGAFTGGFSAGYFNTVGSKEGWTPSTFKSSRGARAQKVQSAEDFMDDEDREQMRADRKLENTEAFRSEGFGGTADELSARGDFSGALGSLVQPARTSIGEQMMIKLGWRPGQGVGPRVSARRRAMQEARAARLAGLPVPAASGEEGEAPDEEMKRHTFAPRDAKLQTYDAKAGRQGLGFVAGPGLDMGRALAAARAGGGIASGTRAETSAGFGLGLEDADEDDLDVYHAGPGRDESTLGAFEGGEREVILLGEDRRKDGRGQSKQAEGPKAQSHGQGFWNDGRPVLPGFVLDSKAVTQDKWFAFPSIPADWHPRPSRVWNRVSRWDRKADAPAPAAPTNAMGLGKRPQTAEERGQALGEEVRVAPLKSVFEYMSAKSKERLAKFAAINIDGTGESKDVKEDAPEDPANMAGLEVPPISPRTASAALMGFIPFGDDPPKQERYKSYLQSQTYNSTAQPKLLPARNVEAVNKELQDFAKSATIFKPMSFAMANRFTSSKSSAADMKQPAPGLHMPDPSKIEEAAKEQAAANAIEEELTPAQAAARAGFFGERTRVVQEWYPNKLLCKRFGVADPHPEGEPGKAAPAADGETANAGAIAAPPPDLAWTEKYVHQSTPPASAAQDEPAPVSGLAPAEPRRPRNIAEVGLAGDESQGRDILIYEKPSIDIFRAIFQDDSSDDEDEDEPSRTRKGPEQAGAVSARASPPPAAPISRLPQAPALAAQPAIGGADFEIISETTIAEPYAPIVFQAKGKDGEADADRKKSKKAKKEKDRAKKNTKILMSFDVADGEEGEEDAPRMAKKRKDERGPDKIAKKSRVELPAPAPVAVAEEDDEWVEAAPPAVSNGGPATAPAPSESKGTLSSRKRAADFL